MCKLSDCTGNHILDPSKSDTPCPATGCTDPFCCKAPAPPGDPCDSSAINSTCNVGFKGEGWKTYCGTSDSTGKDNCYVQNPSTGGSKIFGNSSVDTNSVSQFYKDFLLKYPNAILAPVANTENGYKILNLPDGIQLVDACKDICNSTKYNKPNCSIAVNESTKTCIFTEECIMEDKTISCDNNNGNQCDSDCIKNNVGNNMEAFTVGGYQIPPIYVNSDGTTSNSNITIKDSDSIICPESCFNSLADSTVDVNGNVLPKFNEQYFCNPPVDDTKNCLPEWSTPYTINGSTYECPKKSVTGFPTYNPSLLSINNSNDASYGTDRWAPTGTFQSGPDQSPPWIYTDGSGTDNNHVTWDYKGDLMCPWIGYEYVKQCKADTNVDGKCDSDKLSFDSKLTYNLGEGADINKDYWCFTPNGVPPVQDTCFGTKKECGDVTSATEENCKLFYQQSNTDKYYQCQFLTDSNPSNMTCIPNNTSIDDPGCKQPSQQ